MNRLLGTTALVSLTIATSAIVGVVACSSSSDASPDGPNGTGPDGSTGPTTDGGSSGDAGFDSAAPRRTVKVGRVEIANQGSSWRAEAHIYEKYEGPFPKPCERHVVGNCEFEDCLRDDNAPWPPPDNSTYAHAGSIEFTGARIPEGTTLAPEANGDYKMKAGADYNIWQAGESLQIRAAGNPSGVGAFDVTLTAPRGLRITEPEPPEGETLTVPRNVDFNVGWEFDGLASGKVSVWVNRGGQTEAPEIQTVTCTFDPAAGKGKIPASMLSRLLAGSALVGFSVIDEQKKDVGGYEITTLATRPSGGGPILLE